MNGKYINIKTLAIVLCLSAAACWQCAPVKGYQKVYLNDEEMQLNNQKLQIFESNFQSYREGATGGTNGNSGSGCGCN